MMESVSDTLARYYEALKEIAGIDPSSSEMDEMQCLDMALDIAQKAIAPVDEVTVASQWRVGNVKDLPESITVNGTKIYLRR